MPNNKVDQAPRIKNNGEKKLKNSKNGFAMRPHDLETIFFTLIPSKNVVQLKVMFYLTGNAEGFKLIKEATLERLGVSSSAYYKARDDLKERGWISIEEDNEYSYIVVNYNKIYEDGKNILSKEEGISEKYPVEESNCENTSVSNENNKKEGNCENTSEEGNIEKYSEESNCENTSLQKSEEGITDKYSESITDKYSEGYTDKYYNRIREENKDNKIMSAAEEFLKDWGDQAQDKIGGHSSL